MENKTQNWIKHLHQFEDWLLVGMLGGMILLAIVQIALRNIFDSGIVWGDALLRIMVLWVALLGATVATRANNHIRIDILSRILPPGINRISDAFVALFTATVCAIITYYSIVFIGYEYEDNTIAFAQVPVWICQSIMPIAFSIMALRFLLHAFLHLIGREVKDGLA